ncbi:MAG: HigA family addiction module antidote protein [Gemmatimonadetes bacterium]|nr:HigA family addiction module antidote protein [Gemmatimonadota bacterium]
MLKRVVHPGEILRDELAEFGVSPATFARQIDVPPDRIGQIIEGRCSVDGDTALRFGHWFGVDPLFWLNLQMQFNVQQLAKQAVSGSKPSGSRLNIMPR